jgi:hypothetical protein
MNLIAVKGCKAVSLLWEAAKIGTSRRGNVLEEARAFLLSCLIDSYFHYVCLTPPFLSLHHSSLGVEEDTPAKKCSIIV